MMMDVSETLRDITALAAMVIMLAPIYGFARILPRAEAVVRYFSTFAIGILAISITRAIYGAFIGPVPDWLGITFNLLYILSMFACLKSFHLMIPDGDRAEYPWWKSHLYPPIGPHMRRCLMRLFGFATGGHADRRRGPDPSNGFKRRFDDLGGDQDPDPGAD